jgi:Tfp pilus assembly protein FimT
MVELITVLVLVGVLAVVAMPRLDGAISMRGSAWRDQLQAAVLQARSLAAGHRRLVCLAVATGELRLSMASANPATSCNTSLPGPDGDARWAVDPQNLAITATPEGTLHFQPDGRVTRPGSPGTAASFTLGIAGETSLTVDGTTGHVQ